MPFYEKDIDEIFPLEIFREDNIIFLAWVPLVREKIRLGKLRYG